MSHKKFQLQLGNSDFRSIRERNFYYIDKTLLVKDFLEDPFRCLLITRPRRFGKTLNLSTLRYFFEKAPISTGWMFEGLAIEKHPEVMEHQGQYPVIYLTFKDLKVSSFERALEGIQTLVGRECRRLMGDSEKVFDKDDHEKLIQIARAKADQGVIEESIKLLTEWLHLSTGKKPMLFLDEYDVPIHSIYMSQDYDKFIEFMRNFLSSGLKDNDHLERALLTGILRVSKESIFTGLNNFAVYGITHQPYSEYFGLTEEEVSQILIDFDLEKQLPGVKRWYNGYLFGGNLVIYNPWSVLHYVARPEDGLRPHWMNTSGNDLIRELILDGDSQVQKGIECLLNGQLIETPLDEYTVFRDLKSSAATVWSLMVYTGYLKPVSRQMAEDNEKILFYRLGIPNKEVQYFFEETVQQWLDIRVGSPQLNAMLKALMEGDYETFTSYLRDFVRDLLSYYDVCYNESERVYHAFVLGLLAQLQSPYIIRSNRESGYGRYDVMLIPKDNSKTGIIFEFKKLNSDTEEVPETALESALKQIEKKHYAAELLQEGITQIDSIAIVIDQKKLWMKTLKGFFSLEMMGHKIEQVQ